MVFFGRLAYKFANTLARGFGLARPIGATVFRRRFRHDLQRLFAHLLRQVSDYAAVRHCFVFLMLFAVCLLDIYLLMTDVRSWVG